MNETDKPIRVMVAGIGGASLGTEIRKCLSLAGGYAIYGCDVSRTAYGLYEKEFVETRLVSKADYIADVLRACREFDVQFLIPGGEQPMALLGGASRSFEENGIKLLANTPEVIALYSDKARTFKRLSEYEISIPKTVVIHSTHDIATVGLPCIVKPATGSGGSAGVFFAINVDEAMIYAQFIERNGNQAVAQQYIDDSEGEFTIGVLSLPNGSVAGSIALRRTLDAKLSVAYRSRGGLISSGYSQGHIDEYHDLCRQAERIAEAIGSCGPINVQGRVQDGVLLPFEINPRFSASTFLRALAGFNEIHTFITYFKTGETPARPRIKSGWYLRSLSEQFLPDEGLKRLK